MAQRATLAAAHLRGSRRGEQTPAVRPPADSTRRDEGRRRGNSAKTGGAGTDRSSGSCAAHAALLLPAPLSSTTTQAAAQVADEPSLKAAFISTSPFTTWPAKASAVTGRRSARVSASRLGEAFDKTLQGKKVAGRPVELKYLERLKKDDVCNVIYIAPSEKSRVKKIVETSAVGHALTISDLDGFADDGGMIRLVKVNDTIKF
jgi:hypothetical protein